MSKHDQESLDLDEDTGTRRGPGFGHFYILLLLVVLVGGAVGYLFYTLNLTIAGLETKLADVQQALSDDQASQAKKLKRGIGDLEIALEETNKRLGALSAALNDDRAALVDYRTQTDKALADIGKSLEDQTRALADLSTELTGKIEAGKAEFAEKNEQMNTVVAQIQDDSKYIIGELGKKAEKAYLRFMERKLRKKITGVSEKVDGVKGELELQIAATQERITEIAGGIGEEIKKKVEDHVKIDFVPSASDEE